jgi:hypothetical protein
VAREDALGVIADEGEERVDSRPGPEERVLAERVPPIVVEDERAAGHEELPRERCVDEDVEAEMRSVDVDEVEGAAGADERR